ncbi:MAG: signal peptidase I [Coriobacteriales bacterium]|nr:signal peptidase I [Coriobacteriales bacterium]
MPEDAIINEGEQGEPNDRRRTVIEWSITIAVAVGIAILIHVFVGEPFIVPTGSMLDTIQLDDRIWGEKISYHFRDPEQGEVIMFDNPNGEGTVLIKRVIATAGQTVDLVDGKVVVDGQVLDEPYTSNRPSLPLNQTLPGTEPVTYPITVPEGCVWVMGDNRTNSLDSRYFGAVPTSSVVARALFTFWPLSNIKGF